eukprot:796750-Pyramimonas_sp.AAC.1
MADFAAANASLQWREASAHFCGEGLEQGPDNTSLRRLLKELQGVKKGGKQLAEVLLNVAVGGSWPLSRKKGCGACSVRLMSQVP